MRQCSEEIQEEVRSWDVMTCRDMDQGVQVVKDKTLQSVSKLGRVKD